MSVHLASFIAVALSIVALGVTLVGVPLIYSKIANIRSSLRAEMDNFNVAFDDAWKEIQLARHKTGAPHNSNRVARQVGECRKLLIFGFVLICEMHLFIFIFVQLQSSGLWIPTLYGALNECSCTHGPKPN